METTNLCIYIQNQLQMLKLLSPTFSGLHLASCNQHIQNGKQGFKQSYSDIIASQK